MMVAFFKDCFEDNEENTIYDQICCNTPQLTKNKYHVKNVLNSIVGGMITYFQKIKNIQVLRIEMLGASPKRNKIGSCLIILAKIDAA